MLEQPAEEVTVTDIPVMKLNELQRAKVDCAHCGKPKELETTEEPETILQRCGICGHFVHASCVHPEPQGLNAPGGAPAEVVLRQNATRQHLGAKERYAIMVQTDENMLRDHYRVGYQCAHCVVFPFEVKHKLVVHLISRHSDLVGMRVKEGVIPFATEDADGQ